MSNFNLSELALQAVCPENKILYDSKGLPSVMVWIPKFNLSEVLSNGDSTPHPAFVVNGNTIDGFWVSKYDNMLIDDLAYSIPLEAPDKSLKYDESMLSCENKGYGWHLMTRAEWAAIALLCVKNGFLPKGNDGYGKDLSETSVVAMPVAYYNSLPTLVATGSGPLTWSHDNTINGLWDLKGNLYKSLGGIRMIGGEIQILEKNNAADSEKSQGATSPQWKCIKASDGTLMQPNGVGTTSGSVKLHWDTDHWKWDTATPTATTGFPKEAAFSDTTCSANISSAAKLLLEALCLIPDPAKSSSVYGGAEIEATITASNEAMIRAGGTYGLAGGAGVFKIRIVNNRTFKNGGTRAAYIDPTSFGS